MKQILKCVRIRPETKERLDEITAMFGIPQWRTVDAWLTHMLDEHDRIYAEELERLANEQLAHEPDAGGGAAVPEAGGRDGGAGGVLPDDGPPAE